MTEQNTDYHHAPWDSAGVSRSSWYRYLKEFRSEADSYGMNWLIEKLKERTKIKVSLSETTKRLACAKSALKMRKK